MPSPAVIRLSPVETAAASSVMILGRGGGGGGQRLGRAKGVPVVAREGFLEEEQPSSNWEHDEQLARLAYGWQ